MNPFSGLSILLPLSNCGNSDIHGHEPTHRKETETGKPNYSFTSVNFCQKMPSTETRTNSNTKYPLFCLKFVRKKALAFLLSNNFLCRCSERKSSHSSAILSSSKNEHKFAKIFFFALALVTSVCHCPGDDVWCKGYKCLKCQRSYLGEYCSSALFLWRKTAWVAKSVFMGCKRPCPV